MDKRILPVLLCLAVLLSMVPVAAQAAGTLVITSEEDFLKFTQRCVLDRYSQELTVKLQTDLDLSGVDFAGVPIFCGTFEGSGHTISGVDLRDAGSDKGLFRTLTDTAVVRDLTVSGTIAPTGSRARVGGIAGINHGTIENCLFRGSVSGSDHTGGIAGINGETGRIVSCKVEGTVQGLHFVGGIAGENKGVIRDCGNFASVNTEALHNQVDLSDITVESITGSEAAITATDIGGIAGSSSGTIASCTNDGGVGYRHMGYNIGGIVGSQRGYVGQCINRGNIAGRKEIGGIVGQTVPVTRLDFAVDTLQLLKEQMDTLSLMVEESAVKVEGSASSVTGELGDLRDHTQTAMGALGQLMPEDGKLPSLDDISQAQNTITGSLSAMPDALDGILGSLSGTASVLSAEMEVIKEQMKLIQQTMDGARETMGGSLTDASGQDTDQDYTGKIAGCVNFGSVLGDLNVGGIVGAMAFENDLDPEDDIQLYGENSMNFEGQFRSVVRQCENYGIVTIGKQMGGGVVGWQSIGLTAECVNTGAVYGYSANYVGGIAGRSSGWLRQCSVKAEVLGHNYVGGVAGSGAKVTDCRSMNRISGNEKLGAVLGYPESRFGKPEPELSYNYYTAVGTDPGAVDGVSYAGLAEGKSLNAFLSLAELPEFFQTVNLRFLFEDGSVKTLSVSTGDPVAPEDIPQLPEKFGYVGFWQGLDALSLDEIHFDALLTAGYLANSPVIAGEACRENGLPILLVQGSFLPDTVLNVESCGSAPVNEKYGHLLESWEFSVSSSETAYTARFLLPEGLDEKRLTILLGSDNGVWSETDYTIEGSYAVFSLSSRTDRFAIYEAEIPQWQPIVIAAAGGALAVALIIGIVAAIVRGKRRTSQEKAAQEDNSSINS